MALCITEPDRTHKNPTAPRHAPSRIWMPAVRAVPCHVNDLENGAYNIQVFFLDVAPRHWASRSITLWRGVICHNNGNDTVNSQDNPLPLCLHTYRTNTRWSIRRHTHYLGTWWSSAQLIAPVALSPGNHQTDGCVGSRTSKWENKTHFQFRTEFRPSSGHSLSIMNCRCWKQPTPNCGTHSLTFSTTW
jgi:hypothetical protein